MKAILKTLGNFERSHCHLCPITIFEPFNIDQEDITER